MAATEQLNVRLDADLKRRGTEALASIGLTPTQAIRGLWERAAERGEGLDEVRSLVSGEMETGDEDERVQPSSLSLEEGWKIVDRARKKYGLAEAKPLDLTDDELMELSYRDRGWL